MFRQLQKTTRVFTRASSSYKEILKPVLLADSSINTRFGHPSIVSFDLWGTLFTPRKPVPQQYFDISNGEFGITKLVQSIEREFPGIFSQMEQKYPNYGKYSGEIASSDEWWLALIRKLYGLAQNDPLSEKLCRRLIDHFCGDKAYVLYDDVIPVLDTLRNHDVTIIGATNSDHRVFSIMESLGISEYFPHSSVFLSYDLGVAKPSRDFFCLISDFYYEQALKEGRAGSKSDFLLTLWHVGDHYEKDFRGSVKSGWNGVLLDREKKSEFMRAGRKKELSLNEMLDGQTNADFNGNNLMLIADNRICVSGLTEVLTLFGYDKN